MIVKHGTYNAQTKRSGNGNSDRDMATLNNSPLLDMDRYFLINNSKRSSCSADSYGTTTCRKYRCDATQCVLALNSNNNKKYMGEKYENVGDNDGNVAI